MWEAAVWKFSWMGKCRPNWYEGRFRWKWMAYLAARFMAIQCDLLTPKLICLKDGIQTKDGFIDDWIESPYGIAWGIREVKE